MLKEKGQTKVGLLAVFSVLTLSACGGGGDDGNPPTRVNFEPGIFLSVIESQSEGAPKEAFTLISTSGKYAITSGLTRMSGTLAFPNRDTFSDDDGAYVFFNEKWMSIDGSLIGTAINLEEFTARFTAEPNVGLDIISVRHNELSDLGVTLQKLSGIYSLPDSAFVITIVADESEGIVTGVTTDNGVDGCVINGSVTIPDPALNIFEGSLTFSGCPSIDTASSEQRNGEYDVIGYLQPLNERGSKRLVFSGDNDKVTTVFSGEN